MKVDPTITAAVITSLITFLALHYFIEPRKEKRKRKEERLKNLYGPLYTIIIARITAAALLTKVEPKSNIHFGYAGRNNFINDDYMIQFFMKNSSFASNNLIQEMHLFIEHITETEGTTPNAEELVMVVIKEYNQIKKDLNLEYNEQELQTGLPNLIVDIRNKKNESK